MKKKKSAKRRFPYSLCIKFAPSTTPTASSILIKDSSPIPVTFNEELRKSMTEGSKQQFQSIEVINTKIHTLSL